MVVDAFPVGGASTGGLGSSTGGLGSPTGGFGSTGGLSEPPWDSADGVDPGAGTASASAGGGPAIASTGALERATDGGEDSAVPAGFGKALGLVPLAFAFLTAQALRAFSVRAAAAHSVRRADEDFLRLAFGLAAGADKPTAGDDAAAARDGSALAASASTIALESTAARSSKQSRTVGRRWTCSKNKHPFRHRDARRRGLYGGLARTPIGCRVAELKL